MTFVDLCKIIMDTDYHAGVAEANLDWSGKSGFLYVHAQTSLAILLIAPYILQDYDEHTPIFSFFFTMLLAK